jgi:DNA-binding transcriptional MerR regulator
VTLADTVVLSPVVELTVDQLARRAELPVRTIREYQSLGLVPSPSRRGRVGVYRAHHLERLALIRRLQARGYSLAGIGDLLESWREGGDLGEVLGLTADQLVHVEEPGAPATLDQLARVVPDLVPERLDDLVAVGIIEAGEAGDYCVPSPSLLQLARDATVAGYEPDAVIAFLRAIKNATDAVAEAAVAVVADRPPGAAAGDLVAFATRARGLLAHGIGRLAIHALGKRLGIADETAVADGLRQLMEVEDR